MNTRYIGIVLLFLLITTPIHAEVVSETITYEHNGQVLEGFLAYNDGIPGKRPGVLVVHEWWGLNDYARSRVRQLARLGYVAFALDMYGKGMVTTHPSQAADWMNAISQNISLWQERASAGLEILLRQPRVDKTRIAAIGYCFGGATVQQLAYTGATLRGVVSFHGQPIAPSQEQIQRVGAKILLFHGAADPFVKVEQLNRYIAAMNPSGLDWQMISYGGAKHSFTNPDADKTGIPALAYNRSADQRSWLHMRVFFDEIF